MGYSWQHLGAIERGSAVPSEVVVTACDAAVLANGRLLSLLPAVIREQARVRHQHEAARRPGRSIDLVGARARQVCDHDELDWERLADATQRPSRLSTAVVDDLELITDRQRPPYHELSSAEMMVHVQAHVGLLMSLLDNVQPEVLRHRIASAAAEAAGFAASMCSPRHSACAAASYSDSDEAISISPKARYKLPRQYSGYPAA